MPKETAKIDLLKEAQKCVEQDKELREHVKLDIGEDTGSGADLELVILSDLPFNWELWDRVQEVVYNCLEKYDPYITLHFEWKKL
jgi:hypothetical protein